MKAQTVADCFKLIMLLTGIALLVNTSFIGLHYLGDLTPKKKVLLRIQEGIGTQNILPEDYPVFRYGLGTPYVLAGLDQFTDCNIVYQMSMFTSENTLRNAIVPGIAEPPADLKKSTLRCERVIGMATGKYQPDPTTTETKARLWHGAKAVFQLLAPYFDIFQMKMLLQLITYLASMLLGSFIARSGGRFAGAMLPFGVFGILFSGIPYFSDLSNGLPYMVVMLGLVLVQCLGRMFSFRSWRALALILTVFGSIHAFFFVTDGAEMLVVPLLMIVLYFTCLNDLPVRKRYLQTFSLLAVYVAAMAGSLLFKQLVSAMVLGFGQVYSEFMEVFMRRISSDMYGSHVTIAQTLEKLTICYLTEIFWIKGLYHFLIYSSMAAWSLGLSLLVYQLIDGRDRDRAADAAIFLFAGIAVLARYILMRNHSYEHAAFVSRYLFVFFASGWALMLYLLPRRENPAQRDNREESNHPVPPSRIAGTV